MNALKSIRKAVGLGALPLLLVVASPQLGCLGHRGPSEVAQGQRYESGDPTYDQFFAAVHDLQVEMAKAPQEEARLRLELAKPLGVEAEEYDEAPAPAPAKSPPTAAATPTNATATPSLTDAYGDQLGQTALNAVPGGAAVSAISQQVKQAQQTFGALGSTLETARGSAASATPQPTNAAPSAKKGPKAPSAAMLSKAVKARAKKLGLEMKLEVDRNAMKEGEAKTSLRTAGETTDVDAKKLAELVERTAKREIEIVVRMNATKKKLAKLSSISGALEASVDSAFRKSRGQAAEVRKNLDDAQALIELMQARADELTRTAERMLSRLEDAASADLAKTEPAASAVASKSEANKGEGQTAPVSPKAKAAKTSSGKSSTPRSQPSPAKAPKTVLADFEP